MNGKRIFTPKSLFLFFLVLLFSFPFVSADVGNVQTGEVHLPIFLIIVGFGILLFLGGLTFDDSGLLIIASMVLFFIIGLIIQQGSLYLPNGNTYSVYGNDFSEDHWDSYNGTSEAPSQADREAFLFHEQKEYEAWDGNNNQLVGWLIMIVSALIFALTLFYLGTGDD
jgi:hypothetical protein